jgi:hypothetical protein
MNRRQFTLSFLAASGGLLLAPRLLGKNVVGLTAAQQRLAKAAKFSGPGMFGIHYDLQPDSNDARWLSEVSAENLRAEWKKVKPDWIQCDCKGSAGLSSYFTKAGNPTPAMKKDPLRIHRDVTRELGLPLLVHFCGIWDLAASVANRDWTRRDASGQAETGKMCVRSAYVHERMIPQMVEVAVDYDVDGFWVDGDVWTMQPCYCRRCRDAFEVDTGISDPPLVATDANWPAWLAFHRRSYQAYAKAYTDAVHQHKPDCLVCINWHYSVSIPDPISLEVDFLSGDANSDDQITVESRFFAGRGLPWNVMTWGFIGPPYENTGGLNKSAPTGQFRALAETCQGAAESLAVGGGAIIFARPTQTGHLVSWEHDQLAQVAEFVHARRAISLNSIGVPQAVVLNSRSSVYTRSIRVNEIAGHLADRGALIGAVHALLTAGYSTDVLNEEDLMERLDQYGLVVIPESNPITPSMVRALAKYLENGGRVVLSGAFIAADPTLAELAGVAPKGAPLNGYYYLPSGAESSQIKGPWQPVTLKEAKEFSGLLATPEAGDFVGTPAITLNRLGKGQIAAIHGAAFAAFTRDRNPQLGQSLTELFRALWPHPTVLVESVANGILTSNLRKQEGRYIVHLLNRTITSQRETTVRRHVEHLPPIGPVKVKMQLAARPARVVCEPADAAQPNWDWAEGTLSVTVPSVEIHSALVVEI